MEFLEFSSANNLFSKGDTIILAVSGGSDSLCMLGKFLEIKEEYNLKLCLAHVNHLYRKEASSDAQYVRELGKKYGLDFYLEEKSMVDVARKEGLSIEEAGRKIRYDFFYRLKEDLEKNTDKNVLVATAHNKNDLVETFFLNLFRGTGLKGLTGIKAKTDSLIRPILFMEKKEIESYVKERGFKVRIDKTNFQNEFTRNSIRNELIPFIKEKYQENIIENIFRTAALLGSDYDLINLNMDDFINEFGVFKENKCILDRDSFLCKPKAFKLNLIRRIIFKFKGTLDGFTKAQFEEILNFLGSISGKEMKILGISFRISFDKILIEKTLEKDVIREINPIIISTLEDTSINFCDYKIDIKRIKSKKRDKTKAYYFSKDLNKIIIRSRKDGDRLLYSEGKSKKLKDIFIESKLDKNLRDKEPIFTDENGDIILVSNIRRSSRYFTKDGDEEMVMINIKKVNKTF